MTVRGSHQLRYFVVEHDVEDVFLASRRGFIDIQGQMANVVLVGLVYLDDRWGSACTECGMAIEKWNPLCMPFSGDNKAAK
jgi:hypothetical protein